MATINNWNNAVTAANVTFNGGTMNIGSDSTDNAINIATAASSGRTVTIGNTTSASVLALKFGTGDFTIASATGTVMTVLDTGEMTRPLQPAFLAYLPSSDASVTGDGTAYTLGGTTALTEVIDQNSDFNTNGTFTAPVTGRYVLCQNVTFDSVASGGTEIMAIIATSNRSYYHSFFPTELRVTNCSGASGYLNARGGALADMDAADTATATFTSSGGSKNDGIIGGATLYTAFSGYLAV